MSITATEDSVVPGPCVTRVNVSIDGPFSEGNLWMEDLSYPGGIQLIEGIVSDVACSYRDGRWFGQVMFSVPQGQTLELSQGDRICSVRQATETDVEQVRYCREEQVRHSRSAFRGSTDKVATYVGMTRLRRALENVDIIGARCAKDMSTQ